jgi:hypothetical protein
MNHQQRFIFRILSGSMLIESWWELVFQHEVVDNLVRNFLEYFFSKGTLLFVLELLELNELDHVSLCTIS